MTVLLLPPVRVARSLPVMWAAAGLLPSAPAFVAWAGTPAEPETRLRVVGLLLSSVPAMVWEDRCAALTAQTPVGLPAVRRGRLLAVTVLLAVGWLLSCRAAGGGVHVGALTLQSLAIAMVVLALVGWISRDREGEALSALPLPVLLITVLALSRLPRRVSLLSASPGSAEWPAERTRWLVLLCLAAAVAVRLGRDPARR